MPSILNCENTAIPEVGGKVGVLRQVHGIRIVINAVRTSLREPVVERVVLCPHSGEYILIGTVPFSASAVPRPSCATDTVAECVDSAGAGARMIVLPHQAHNHY